MVGMDGYVRVSRVAGRKGESYISPKVQRDKITGWAKLHEVPLGEVVVEEDVSARWTGCWGALSRAPRRGSSRTS